MGELHKNGAHSIGLPDKFNVHNFLDRSALEGRKVRVTVDGEEMERVVAYDVKKGSITRYKLDENRRLILKDGRAVTEKVKGKVKVSWA